jgi:hypothetical protein
MSQQDNTFQKKKSKTMKWIIIVILGVTIIPIILVVGMFAYVASVISHEDPYNESNTALIINRIESNFGFKLPEKMESLQAGDTIAAGIDHPYVFVLRFVTNQNGLGKLIQVGDLTDVTEEIANSKWDDSRSFTKHTPQWYKIPLEKGRTYENCLVSKNNTLRLNIICVEMTPSESVVVYMQGWGSHSFDISKGTQSIK